MNIQLPLNLDNQVTITYTNGLTCQSNTIDVQTTLRGDFSMAKVSGYDSSPQPIRITNIVGWKNNHFLKHCPECNLDKPSSEFGISGRVVDSKRRDQSHCNKCRGKR